MTKNRTDSFMLRTWTLATACVVAATASACGTQAGGEGSESPFVCEADADCKHLGAAFTCHARRCTDEPPEGGAGPFQTLATPGVCFGEQNRCEPIAYEPLQPAPLEDGCPLSDVGTPLPAEWIVDLETTACPAPGCLQSAYEILAAPGGHLWVNAQLRPPSPEENVSNSPVGVSLTRFDAAGHLDVAPLTAFQSRLSARVPAIQGLHLRTEGGIFRAAPTPSFRGIELQQYDASGVRLRARTVVDSAFEGMVAWGEDGSAAVAYSDPPMEGADGGPDVYDPVDIARFDASGRLLWNQPDVSSVEEESRWTLVRVHVDPEGNTTAIFRERLEPQAFRLRIVQLDLHGNARWARVLESGAANGIQVFPDGTLLIGHEIPITPSIDEPWGDEMAVLDEIAPDGTSTRRLSMAIPYYRPPAVDGRRLINLNGGFADAISYQVLDLDSWTCTTYETPVPECPDHCFFSGETPIAAFDGALYFAEQTRVGMVRLPKP